MTIRLPGRVTTALKAIQPIEDEESLPCHLVDCLDTTVNWRECDKVGITVVQVLMMSSVKLTGPPRNIYLTRFVAPPIDDGKSGRRSRSGA
jgi:hypothetical protein